MQRIHVYISILVDIIVSIDDQSLCCKVVCIIMPVDITILVYISIPVHITMPVHIITPIDITRAVDITMLVWLTHQRSMANSVSDGR